MFIMRKETKEKCPECNHKLVWNYFKRKFVCTSCGYVQIKEIQTRFR